MALSKKLVKLAVELVKYHSKNIFGDSATTTIVNSLTDIVGEDVTAKISSFLDQGKKEEELLAAFKYADDCFIDKSDDFLRQCIVSKPFSGLEHLEEIANKTTDNLDNQILLEAIKNQFIADWGDKLTSDEVDEAAQIYKKYLDRGLAIKCGQFLPAIFSKVEYIEDKVTHADNNITLLLEKTIDWDNLLRLSIDQKRSVNVIQFSKIPTLDSPPIQAFPFINRTQLILDLEKELGEFPWLSLVDSPGKGKTQVAVSIGLRYRNFYWLSLRRSENLPLNHFREQLMLWVTKGNNDNNLWSNYLNVVSTLDIITLFLKTIEKDSVIIIDDLPDYSNNKDLFQEIEILINELIKKEIRIITTSQRPLPINITNNFAASMVTKACPFFSKEEIGELLQLSGASDWFLKDGIIYGILAITKGHPILVSSTISWLKTNNWSESLSIDGLITGEPIKETLIENQRVLLTTLGEKEKELLFRLSIINENFSKTVAIEIARIEPSITYPEETFYNLLGPWIDQLENQNYDLTPLLAKCGNNNIEFPIQKSIHLSIVKNKTNNNVINMSDAFSIFNHLWSAKEYIDASQVLLQILNAPKTMSEAKYIDWATVLFLGVPWPTEFSLNLRIEIRVFQIKTAKLAGNELDKLYKDLEYLLSISDDKTEKLGPIIADVNLGIIDHDLPLQISLPRSFSLIKKLGKNKKLLLEFFTEEVVNKIPDAVWSQALRINSYEEAYLLLDEISKLSDKEKALLFSAPLALEICEHLVEFTWKKEEADTSNQYWNEKLNKISELRNYPCIINFLPFQIACSRAQSIIYAYQLSDIPKAIDNLAVYQFVEDTNAQFLISYSQGCFYYDSEIYEKAKECLLLAEHYIGNNFLFYRGENKRKLAILESKNEVWENAKELCIETIHFFRKSENIPFFLWDSQEMLGELAFIHWKTERFQKACAALFGYVNSLVGSDEHNLRYKEAFNKAGHGLGWFLNIAEKGKPPLKNMSGGAYSPVQAGLFGARNEGFGKFESPVGFSKTILLKQVADLSSIIGLKRLAWKAYKQSIHQNLSANNSETMLYPITLCSASVLEFFFGDLDIAIKNMNIAIYHLAIIKKAVDSNPKDLLQNKNKLVIDLTSVETKSLEVIQDQCLYMVYIPIFLRIVNSNLTSTSYTKQIQKLNKLMEGNNYSTKEKLIYFLKSLNEMDEVEFSSILIEFKDQRIIQILWYLTKSINPQKDIKEAFVHQYNACLSLTIYGSLIKPMIPEITKMLFEYWIKISREKRFLLHAPDEFHFSLSKQTSNFGPNSLVKILNYASKAVKIHIPEDKKNELSGLIDL